MAEKRALELADAMNVELIDVELSKESAGRFLRFFIDKPGGIDIDCCEAFHRAMLKYVEDIDYDYMEVSSPGVDRPLKKPRDFERAMGDVVEVRLYKPRDGLKVYSGRLTGFMDDNIAIDTGFGEMLFERKSVALVKKVFDFDESLLQGEEDENEPDD
ncbi:MAG: ribosome maturation factor RimP [Clostridia bacterium]|nr:ribosome maturation factor RimP [Clostridia bacterium]